MSARVPPHAAEERIAGGARLPQGDMTRLDLGGVPICLVHAEDGRFYAIGDLCTHEEASLSEGWVSGTEVECPRHNSMFDLRTGEPTSLPATEPAQTYPVTLDGADVLVRLAPLQPGGARRGERSPEVDARE